MSSTNPTILIVPGSFSPPYFYTPISDSLRAAGYDTYVVSLPSIGRKPGPAPTMLDDAAYIADAVTKVADEGKDILLVAHSYGGIPATQAVKGLAKAQRKQAGKTGGIVRLAYLSALAPLIGGTAGTASEGTRLTFSTSKGAWMYHDIAPSATFNFSDLPEAEGQAWVRKFENHSAVTFAGELTHPGYADVEISWLMCKEDKTIPPSFQQGFIDGIEKATGRKVVVDGIETGHCPNASAPEKVVEWIKKAAQEKV
ncbi:alpha/beta-hydrolase [Mytilinidion resinicola]|uniref:Alpha/beta-hydrolase n=1 Tax=Mytilinidion resinicola TaxID=574789 RepID=A0A6A6XY56_9PEZI|nr:alpha/beta-hydrolase [Mytilinidion resinicola]KAF2801360.1 alpha/beta-hydrolase [Mytilinidion resinicola]